MRKARVSIESGAVRQVLQHHSIQVDAQDVSDLDEAEIVVRLRKYVLGHFPFTSVYIV